MARKRAPARPDRIGQIKYANKVVGVIGAGVAAREGFERSKNAGGSTYDAVKSGAKETALPTITILAKPIISPIARASARKSDQLANTAARAFVTSQSVGAKIGFVAAHASTKAIGMSLKGLHLLTRVAPLVGPAVGAIQGSAKDSNRLRGAIRGAINSYDPSSLVMERSVSEKAFDSLFGEAEKPTIPLKQAVKQQVRIVASRATGKAKGWANPKVQAAAQAARKRKLLA